MMNIVCFGFGCFESEVCVPGAHLRKGAYRPHYCYYYYIIIITKISVITLKNYLVLFTVRPVL